MLIQAVFSTSIHGLPRSVWKLPCSTRPFQQSSEVRISQAREQRHQGLRNPSGRTRTAVQMRTQVQSGPCHSAMLGGARSRAACPSNPSSGQGCSVLPEEKQQILKDSTRVAGGHPSSPRLGVYAGATASRSHVGSMAFWFCEPRVSLRALSRAGSTHRPVPGPGGGGGCLLGTRLMARRGRSTRTVRMADRLTLCPSREYSIMLGRTEWGKAWGCAQTLARAGAAWPWGATGALHLPHTCPSVPAAGTGAPGRGSRPQPPPRPGPTRTPPGCTPQPSSWGAPQATTGSEGAGLPARLASAEAAPVLQAGRGLTPPQR